jgi:hypothetical protein
VHFANPEDKEAFQSLLVLIPKLTLSSCLVPIPKPNPYPILPLFPVPSWQHCCSGMGRHRRTSALIRWTNERQASLSSRVHIHPSRTSSRLHQQYLSSSPLHKPSHPLLLFHNLVSTFTHSSWMPHTTDNTQRAIRQWTFRRRARQAITSFSYINVL